MSNRVILIIVTMAVYLIAMFIIGLKGRKYG